MFGPKVRFTVTIVQFLANFSNLIVSLYLSLCQKEIFKKSQHCLTIDLLQHGVQEYGCVSSGQYSRTQPFAGKDLTHENLFKSLRGLKKVVDDWNSSNTSTLNLCNLVAHLVDNIHYAGPFTAQLLAKVLIRVGIILRPELLDEAIIVKGSPLYGKVVKLSNKGDAPPNEKKDCVARFLNASAYAIGQTASVAENLYCEMYRGTMKFDLTLPGQPIYATDRTRKTTSLFKYYPTPDGGWKRTPVLLPKASNTPPTGRVLNQSWWLDPTCQQDDIVGTIPFRSGSRGPGKKIEMEVDLTNHETRYSFILAYRNRDIESLNKQFQDKSSKKTKTRHPHSAKAEQARLTARNGDKANKAVWKDRVEAVMGAAKLKDYFVLSSQEITQKYKDKEDIFHNGLGLLQDYPSNNGKVSYIFAFLSVPTVFSPTPSFYFFVLCLDPEIL